MQRVDEPGEQPEEHVPQSYPQDGPLDWSAPNLPVSVLDDDGAWDE